LEATKISSVTGILNGTTNFILSKMETADEDYQTALRRAQALGFAEADPTSDVEGFDVAYKLSILSALAFGRFAKPEAIFREGISNITAKDIAQAKTLGYRIKLIGITRQVGNDQIDVRVHPMLVPLDHPLASVSGSKNGILVAGDAVDEIMLVGPGAGQMPTASAVVGDIINLASALRLPDFASYFQIEGASTWANLAPADDFTCPYYLRILYKDAPGIIGRIGTILGAHNISINSIFQQGISHSGGEVAILTESVNNGSMNKAINELKTCDFLKGIEGRIRIFKPGSTN
jgi:homoserine dehydrogenase